jgi:hypothetical protein
MRTLPSGSPRCCTGILQFTVAPPQHRLYFLPELQGHESFRPTLEALCFGSRRKGQQSHIIGTQLSTMPNAAQIATYEFIRSEIARLRGPQSHTPLSLDQVSALADDGDSASFHVNGARVLIKPSGKLSDAGLPDCPTYACGLLPQYCLPAVAADLLSRGNPHKRFLHSQSHTPESFVAYMQGGTALAVSQKRRPRRISTPTCKTSVKTDPFNFVLQFLPSEIDSLVARRLTNVVEEKAMAAGCKIAAGDFNRENLNEIVRWKMEGVHLTRVMSYVDENHEVCGDLEFYSDIPISASDADLKKVFGSYQLDES